MRNNQAYSFHQNIICIKGIKSTPRICGDWQLKPIALTKYVPKSKLLHIIEYLLYSMFCSRANPILDTTLLRCANVQADRCVDCVVQRSYQVIKRAKIYLIWLQWRKTKLTVSARGRDVNCSWSEDIVDKYMYN